jgi:CheY-like chemotaxis protein
MDTEEKPRCRILVADDSELQRKLHCFYAEQVGCEVDCLPTGEDALEALRTRRYDLILMDCEMPHMDGLEATRRIREMEQMSARLRVPIIGVTESSNRSDCAAAGMDYFVSKNNLALLVPLMQKILRQSGCSKEN